MENRIAEFGSLFSLPLLGLLSAFCSLLPSSSETTFTFEKLLVYQKSVDFADAFCKQTELISRGYASNSFIRTAR